MNPQVTAIILGVKDLNQARQFYNESLGCPIVKDQGECVSLSLGDGSSALALCQWDALAGDAATAPDGSGFRGFTLSAIVGSPERVDDILAEAVRGGGKIAKPARRALWGGYSGYFTDTDGFLWKVASPSGPPIIPRRRAQADAQPGGRAAMPPRETAITLGVSDMTRVRQFYSEGLGCPIDKNYGSKFVSFKLGDGSSTLALYTRDALAGDAGVAPHGSRFRGFTLSAIAGSAEHVGEMLAQAERAGGKIARAAQTGEHGGHFGYFTDPDGNLWRVASDV